MKVSFAPLYEFLLGSGYPKPPSLWFKIKDLLLGHRWAYYNLNGGIPHDRICLRCYREEWVDQNRLKDYMKLLDYYLKGLSR